MNRFKGKKYYISIGYIDPDEHPDKDAKFVESIIVNHKESSYGRVFHDEENDILLPLMPISEIQKKGTEIIFKYLFFPFKARFIKGDNKLIRYTNINPLLLSFNRYSLSFVLRYLKKNFFYL